MDAVNLIELRTKAHGIATDLDMGRRERIEFANMLLGGDHDTWTTRTEDEMALLCVGLNGARIFSDLMDLRHQ